MSGITNPLLLVGLGQRGMGIVRELRATAAAISTPADPPYQSVEALDTRALHRLFEERLTALLQRGTGGQARLDVVLVADAMEAGASLLVEASRALTDVLADTFPVLFPPAAPPEQRSVWITMVLGTPPLVATETGRRFQELLGALDAARPGLRHPALSRCLLVPRQTTSRKLGDEALEAALRHAIQLLFMSGIRGHDTVRDALGHRHDDAWIGTVFAACSELPIARVRAYARWRLALSGLQALLEQAERPTTDPSRAEALRHQLDPEQLLEGFTTGRAAQKVRERAAQISGAEDRLPDRCAVRLTDRPGDLRARYRVLFEPIAKPWSRRTDPTDDPDHQAMLRMVDQLEAETLAAVDRKLRSLLDEQLEPTTALRVLPSLEHALKQVIHTLDEELASAIPPLPSPEPPPPPDDPGLRELEHVIDARPGVRRTAGLCLVMVLGVAVVVALAVGVSTPPPSSIASQPAPFLPAEAWAVGVAVGVVVTSIWQIGVLLVWKSRARRQLARRAQELEAAWRRGGAGQEREQAERLLAVRRRRTAHDLRRRYQAALERLASLRAAIRQSTHRAVGALTDLRVRIGETPAKDDLAGLVDGQDPLSGSLVRADTLARRLDELGLHRDLARWGSEILTVTWPPNGIEDDLPCMDEEQILAACDRALGDLDIASLLGDDAEIGTNTRTFLQRAALSTGWGMRPLDPHGDPVRGRGRDRVVLVAPARLRAAVEGAMADSPIHLVPILTDARVPWLGLLAVWDAFDLASVLRGMER